MPLIPETECRPKRCIRLWLVGFAVVVLPLLAVVAWSGFQPVRFTYKMRGIVFGRTTEDVPSQTPNLGAGYAWNSTPGERWGAFKLPGGKSTGWYGAVWSWPG